MKFSTMDRTSSRPLSARLTLTVLALILSNALVVAGDKESSKASPKPSATVQPPATAKPSGTPGAKSTPSPKPFSTPETKIDEKMEAELLQAEDRFIIAIQNRDVKALEELLHQYYADSFEGRGTAVTKLGTMRRASSGRLPAYRVEKARTVIRSGNDFTVEGLAKDAAGEEGDERRNEWVHVRRLWTKEADRWIATAQIVTLEEGDEPEEKRAD
jgi:hypothetical protein